jgi:hypothetical protein
MPSPTRKETIMRFQCMRRLVVINLALGVLAGAAPAAAETFPAREIRCE